MDVLPIELIITISSSDPIAFARMIRADRRVYKYILTIAGHKLFLSTCMEKRLTDKGVLTYSLITNKLHSFFGEPAITRADGLQKWYQHGKLHRVGGPAVTSANGTQEWYQHGKLHRVDGPAITFANGYQEWCINGEHHREDGPAITYANGRQEWYLHGVKQAMTLL